MMRRHDDVCATRKGGRALGSSLELARSDWRNAVVEGGGRRSGEWHPDGLFEGGRRKFGDIGVCPVQESIDSQLDEGGRGK